MGGVRPLAINHLQQIAQSNVRYWHKADMLRYADLLANKPIVEPTEDCSADNAINQGVNRPNNH